MQHEHEMVTVNMDAKVFDDVTRRYCSTQNIMLTIFMWCTKMQYVTFRNIKSQLPFVGPSQKLINISS